MEAGLTPLKSRKSRTHRPFSLAEVDEVDGGTLRGEGGSDRVSAEGKLMKLMVLRCVVGGTGEVRVRAEAKLMKLMV